MNAGLLYLKKKKHNNNNNNKQTDTPCHKNLVGSQLIQNSLDASINLDCFPENNYHGCNNKNMVQGVKKKKISNGNLPLIQLHSTILKPIS